MGMMRRLLLFILLVCPCFATTAPTLSSNLGLAAGTGTARASASVTWATGDLIVVGNTSEGGSAGESFSVPTATGLTFASVVSHTASSNCAAAIFTATAGAGGTQAITGHLSNGTSNWNMWIWVWHNHGGAGQSASQFTTTKTVSMTPLGGADSGIVWIVGDFAGGTVTPSATPTTPNETTRQATGASTYNYLSTDSTDQTSAGAVSYGIVTTAGGPFSIIVFEIKGSSTAGPNVGLKGKVGFVGRVGVM